MNRFKATVKINEKDYMACARYYLRKYVGIKELVLVIALIVGAFVMYFAFNQVVVAILAGITLLLMAGAVVVYLVVSKKNYKEEFQKRNSHSPWRAIRGMRNMIVHNYGAVDLAIVYDTVVNSIPDLYKMLFEVSC